MCNATQSAESIHPFEEAGLGLAPFRFVGIQAQEIRYGMAVVKINGIECETKPGGTCAFCGTYIVNMFNVESADGKRFHVGCDCIRKLNRADNKMVADAERALHEHQKAQREAKRQEKWQAACERREAVLNAERERNGGLTDREVAQNALKAEEAAIAATMTAKNGWLIDVLKKMPSSDFIDSMISAISRREISRLSDRQLSVLCEIYSRKTTGKTRRSADYKAAELNFHAIVNCTDVED